MQYVNLIYSKSNHPISIIIRLVTWSRWSHVGIIDGDHVIEAKGGKGVIRTPIDEFKAAGTDWEIAKAPVLNTESALEEARSYLGAKYDWWAIFGIWLRTGWDRTEHWVCSELYAQVSKIIRHDRISRFTPEDCWKISITIETKNKN